MAKFRIAHLVARQEDRGMVVSESYEIPPAAVSPGFSVENFEVLRGINTLNDLDRALLELTFAEAGVRAAKAGYDAILVTPFKDYGVSLMRSAVDIPVVGGGQSAMQFASGLGKRFGVVTVYPTTLRGLYDTHIHDCGFDERCSGVYFASEESELMSLVGENGAIHEMGLTRRGALLERVVQSAHRAIAGGADVIVLGCTCMTPIRGELENRLGGVPVVDPLISGYKFAELTLSLGLKHRRKEPSMHAGDLTAMLSGSGIAEHVVVEEACGDSCALMEDEKAA
jgi:allantoin racemase